MYPVKATVYCEDPTHAGIRAWYENFATACHDYGFYAHPLWCFQPDHGGDRGFTVGNDASDNLPQRMEIAIAKMSHPIFRFLSKKDMFPRDSRLSSIVRSCDGDGYKALKAVLFDSHPAFHDQPSTLITAYPKQRDATTLEYFKLFIDFEQLRAYIADGFDPLVEGEPSLSRILVKACFLGSFPERQRTFCGTILSCEHYIDRVLRTHNWTTPSSADDKDPNKPQSPIPADSIAALYAHHGPAEDSPEHHTLVNKHGFSFRGLLGELMYPYVVGRPDIGYAIITLCLLIGLEGESSAAAGASSAWRAGVETSPSELGPSFATLCGCDSSSVPYPLNV